MIIINNTKMRQTLLSLQENKILLQTQQQVSVPKNSTSKPQSLNLKKFRLFLLKIIFIKTHQYHLKISKKVKNKLFLHHRINPG